MLKYLKYKYKYLTLKKMQERSTARYAQKGGALTLTGTSSPDISNFIAAFNEIITTHPKWRAPVRNYDQIIRTRDSNALFNNIRALEHFGHSTILRVIPVTEKWQLEEPALTNYNTALHKETPGKGAAAAADAAAAVAECAPGDAGKCAEKDGEREELPACKYGEGCYQTNPKHAIEYAHPSGWNPIHIRHQLMGDTMSRSVPLCRYGVSCYDKSLKHANTYKHPARPKLFEQHGGAPKILIRNATTTFAISRCINGGPVCVLNFGNAILPGGKAITGKNSPQEESLMNNFFPLYVSLLSAKSTLYRDETLEGYPGFKDSVHILSTPNIRNRNSITPNNPAMPDLTKARPSDIWPFLPNDLHVITAAAPRWERDVRYRDYSKKTIDAALEQHVRPILTAVFEKAITNKDRSIVLGAFGCGAYAPRVEPARTQYVEGVANIFADLCKSSPFEIIVFAIKETDEDEYSLGNLGRTFQSVFAAQGLI